MLKLWLNKIFIITALSLACTAEAKETIEEQLKLREREIEVLAKDFESTMISRTLKSMYEGIKSDPIAGGGRTEEIYREMLLEEYAKVISKDKGFGLAKNISKDIKKGDSKYQKLMRVQNEKAPKPATEQR